MEQFIKATTPPTINCPNMPAQKSNKNNIRVHYPFTRIHLFNTHLLIREIKPANYFLTWLQKTNPFKNNSINNGKMN